jgi:hypothetical protein
MEIDRPIGLADIANLGLTLSEANQILARIQQGWLPRRPTIMRLVGPTARLATEGIISRAGGRIRSRHCSASL